ncbi:MAG: Na(+)-translocating NADH-quinone reductase subunit A [Myxococcota bacterium]|nr:Na(+)-translocating NADH-quinone reductase subunit A [Myxococcota bacterium]
MAVHRIRKGLTLPIAGAPEQEIHEGARVRRVAVLGDDTPGVRARMAVAEGDEVKRGQLLFEDRQRPGVRYTAPGAGRVAAIFRGRRRMLRSVVIQLSEAEREGRPSDAELEHFSLPAGDPEGWSADQLRALLLESGLWRALRERPFSKVPLPDATPHALFVTAIDTNPLAADPAVALGEAREDFRRGLRLVSKLCPDSTHLCVAPKADIPGRLDDCVQVQVFKGPHPAGTVGVHIHKVAPVSRQRSAWHIGYQDVAALGRLAATGVLPVERVVALGGPVVERPRLLKTRRGASIDELCAGELREDGREIRTLSGSVFSGVRASGPEQGFLGAYHTQVSAIAEGNDRRMLGWAMPGAGSFSVMNVFVSRLMFWNEKLDFTTDTNGSPRALYPLGSYERVMPMDIVATYLLRSIVVGDIEESERLGVLELDEEDVALCTFVCPGKTEFGPYLRMNLDRIEKEG